MPEQFRADLWDWMRAVWWLEAIIGGVVVVVVWWLRRPQ